MRKSLAGAMPFTRELALQVCATEPERIIAVASGVPARACVPIEDGFAIVLYDGLHTAANVYMPSHFNLLRILPEKPRPIVRWINVWADTASGILHLTKEDANRSADAVGAHRIALWKITDLRDGSAPAIEVLPA